jgi:hypothetical protein
MLVRRNVQRTAQRAPIVFDAQQHADAVLAGMSGALEAIDIIGDQQFMLAIEQLLQLIERA